MIIVTFSNDYSLESSFVSEFKTSDDLCTLMIKFDHLINISDIYNHIKDDIGSINIKYEDDKEGINFNNYTTISQMENNIKEDSIEAYIYLTKPLE